MRPALSVGCPGAHGNQTRIGFHTEAAPDGLKQFAVLARGAKVNAETLRPFPEREHQGAEFDRFRAGAQESPTHESARFL